MNPEEKYTLYDNVWALWVEQYILTDGLYMMYSLKRLGW